MEEKSSGRATFGALSSSFQRSGTDRGQLLLITGLLIAVVLVMLVLLLNTVIYTENVATRDGGSTGSAAIEFRSAAVDSTGGVLNAENRASPSEHDGYDEVLPAVALGVGDVDNQLATRHSERGAMTNVSIVGDSDVEGNIIIQNESRNFTDDDGNEDFVVASDVDGTRNFVFELDPDMLESDPGDLTNESFHVNVTNGGTDPVMQLFIYEESDDVVVEYAENGDDPSEACRVATNDENVTFDASMGRVSGEDDVDCGSFDWPDDDSYEISFANGDAGGGTYELTVHGDGLTIPVIDDLGGLFEDDEQPFSTEAVYSIELSLQYVSNDVSFETHVRIAPGDPNV